MKFYAAEKLGPKMSRSPEGFLLCEDVPIARTGMQVYHVSELPGRMPDGEVIDWGASDGLVKIHREPDEVFRPETIASFNGKPVVNGHPEDRVRGVDAGNWKELAVGIVINPRRGKGAQDDVLLGDLVVWDEATAKEIVDDRKREVSCGYDAGYKVLGAGEGAQVAIIGNHLALVEAGRCGARCSIGDAEETPMTWFEKFKAALATKNDAEIKKVMDTAPAAVLTADCAAKTGDESGTAGSVQQHFHMASGATPPSTDRKWSDEKLDGKFKEMEDRHAAFDAKYATDHKSVMDGLEEIKKKMTPGESATDNKEVEGELKEEIPSGAAGDAVAKMTDSALLADSFQDVVAKAEIIAPGIGIPIFDSKATPKAGLLAIIQLRKKALTLGNNDPATNALIEKMNGGRALAIDSMTGASLRTLFNGVATLKGSLNSDSRNVSRGTNGGSAETKKVGVSSIADVNKKNAEFWGTRL